MRIRKYQEADRPFLRTLYLASRKAAFPWRDTEDYRLEDFDRSTLGEDIWVAEENGRRLRLSPAYVCTVIKSTSALHYSSHFYILMTPNEIIHSLI